MAKVSTQTITYFGLNNITYEYVVPYGKSTTFYKDAVSVKSKKMGNPSHKYNNRTSVWKSKKNGHIYPKGTYQPIGDKRYFNFYQLKKMDAPIEVIVVIE